MRSDQVSAGTEFDILCSNVAQSVQQIRATFSSNVETSQILARFWALQDHLHRLVDALCDDPDELPRVKDNFPRLITDVAEIVSLTPSTNVGRIAAVRNSCCTISD